MITVLRVERITSSVPKRYPAEFRRKVLDLVAAGRRVAQVAADLDISEQTIYVWRRQELIDTGQLPGISSTESAELRAARRRIAQLETELAIHRRAAGCSTVIGSRSVSLIPCPALAARFGGEGFPIRHRRVHWHDRPAGADCTRTRRNTAFIVPAFTPPNPCRLLTSTRQIAALL